MRLLSNLHNNLSLANASAYHYPFGYLFSLIIRLVA